MLENYYLFETNVSIYHDIVIFEINILTYSYLMIVLECDNYNRKIVASTIHII